MAENPVIFRAGIVNFSKGLASPAVAYASEGGFIIPEAETMLNCEVLRDGSLRRRGGLTNVANFKTDATAASSFIANKGMYYLTGLDKWVVARNTAQIYEVTEGASPGAVIKMFDIARNRLTFAWTQTASYSYEIAGQGDNFAWITTGGVYIYFSSPGRMGYTFERGNYWCRAYYFSGVSGNKSLVYVDVNGSKYISVGDISVPTVMGGALPYNNYLLLIKADGKCFRYSGVTDTDAKLIPIGDNIGSPILYTMVDGSPYGLFFATTNHVYLISRLTEIDNEIKLQNVTEDKFDTPITDGIDNAATTDSDLITFDSDSGAGATASAISSYSGFPASNMNDDNLTTYWQSDNDLTTGKTASASNEDGIHTADKAIDAGGSTNYWSTPAIGATSSEWWRVDLGVGNEQIVKGLKIQPQFDPPFGPGATWNLQGSNDPTFVAWTTLTKTLIAGNYYAITNTTAYRYYQVIGDTTDRGGVNFFANIADLCLLTYGASGTTNYVQLDYGLGVSKTLKKIRLYKGTSTVAPLSDVIFKMSTNGSTWTTITPDLVQAVVETAPNYYYDYYFHANTTAGRYLRVEFTGNYTETAGRLYQIYTYESKTASDTTTGKKAGAVWHPNEKEYYLWFTNADGDYVCYVYNPAKGYWRQFETGSFAGSMGIKNGDLYMSLLQYTPAGGSLQPSGIWKYRTDGLGSDPDAAFTVAYKTGWIEFAGERDYEFNLRSVYLDGKGWTTVNIYYDVDGTTGTETYTVSGENPRLSTEGGLRFKRFKFEAIASVGIADTSKEVSLQEVIFEIAKTRRRV